jgi:hypothetical protein
MPLDLTLSCWHLKQQQQRNNGNYSNKFKNNSDGYFGNLSTKSNNGNITTEYLQMYLGLHLNVCFFVRFKKNKFISSN